jgi:phage-related protein
MTQSVQAGIGMSLDLFPYLADLFFQHPRPERLRPILGAREDIVALGVFQKPFELPSCPLDSMLELAYSTVEDDSCFDEAATFRRGFTGGAARTAGGGQGRDRFALERVQRGKMPENAKPLKGIAPGVLEIVSDFRGDTFRAVYTVRFPKAVYVLHVFQKKSKRGIATPRHEMELVEKRLARVVELEKPSRKNLG